jgi:hypothetical protein
MAKEGKSASNQTIDSSIGASAQREVARYIFIASCCHNPNICNDGDCARSAMVAPVGVTKAVVETLDDLIPIQIEKVPPTCTETGE